VSEHMCREQRGVRGADIFFFWDDIFPGRHITGMTYFQDDIFSGPHDI
jgi:hypothetical protein